MSQHIHQILISFIIAIHKFVCIVYEYFGSKPKSFYKKGIHMLLKRWELVIDNDGKHIID